ncbi:MAG: beta-ketoacyl synthase chain length factor [Vitreoscilla sp.]
MSLSFVIESWAACAPGVDTPQRWSQWAAAPWLPEGEPQVALAAVSPMLRRRFAPLGRLAAQAAFDLAGAVALPDDADPDDSPTVYASRYGETGRCLELLADQARGDALSPTAFGLSVHNAIGAMIALTRGDRRNSSAIAAGRATAAAGVVEALALLDDGARSASLVVYDAPLPAGYASFQDEPSAHFAWAWRLRRPQAGERALHLDWQTPSANDQTMHPQLPASLQALWFGLSDAPQLTQQIDGRRCVWSRDV